MSITGADLKRQWEYTSHDANKGTRLSLRHALKIYIGFDSQKNPCLYIYSREERAKFTSSKSIACTRTRDASGEFVYVMSLLNQAQEDIFLYMCADIINKSAERSEPREALGAFCKRYEEWIEMLGRVGSGLLSAEAQRGLFGELLFLQQLLREHSDDMLGCLEGWKGPDREHRDFIYDGRWYEIKTIRSGVTAVKISSIAQLDAVSTGRLVVYQLDTPGVLTLNSLVEDIRATIDGDSLAQGLFCRRLLKYGYEVREEYDDPSYMVLARDVYVVDDSFPALRRDSLPPAITRASYELSLAALTDWRMDNNGNEEY